jgi:hypothetical protein
LGTGEVASEEQGGETSQYCDFHGLAFREQTPHANLSLMHLATEAFRCQE